MAASENMDRRLQDRRVGRVAQEEIDKAVLALPDSADNAERPSDQEIETLREELQAEKVARDERIQRSLTEPTPVIVPYTPPAPLDDEL